MKTSSPARQARTRHRREIRSSARATGRSANPLRVDRRTRRVEAAPRSGWTAKEVELLGTAPDSKLAERLGRKFNTVRRKRLMLGIESWKARNSRPRPPLDPEKVKLRFGPYSPPRVRRGGFLVCEWRGKVKVGEYTDAPILWPMKWRTRSPILCGDLVEAVRHESAMAVAHHWGVSTTTVSKWRAALEVESMTTGTINLKSHVQTEAMTPTLRTHISRMKAGKPRKMSLTGERRLLVALHRPKSKRWFQSMAPHFKARRGKPAFRSQRLWTLRDDALLGMKPDAEVARIIGRLVGAVAS